MRHLLAAALLLAAPAIVRAQDIGLPVGTTAPAAVVHTLDDKPANLSQFIGKTPVLFEFWATWCPNCKELEPEIAAVHKAFGDRVRIVAVAVSVNQSPERVRRFLAAHPLPVETVYDTEGAATDAYSAPATSYVVLVDRAGKVVYTGLGGDQKLVAAVKKAM